MSLLDLPKDVLSMICKMVSEYDDLVALNRTCKKIHSLIKEQRLFDVVAHPNKIQRFYPDELKEKMRELDLFLKNDVPSKKQRRYDSKIVVLGEGGVGKSASVVQYVQGVFVENYDPTIEDSYRVQKYLGKNKSVCIIPEILDTAGSEQFTAMRDLYMKDAECSVIIMSLLVAIPQSVEERVAEFKKLNKNPNNIVLVSNKIDLKDERIYTRSEGMQLAKEIGCSYIETSAKTRENIDEMFEEAIKLCIVDKIKEETKKTKKTTCVCQ